MADTQSAYNAAHRVDLRAATEEFARDFELETYRRARQNKAFNNQRAVDGRAVRNARTFCFAPPTYGVLSTAFNGSTNAYSSGRAPPNKMFPDASRMCGGSILRGGVLNPNTVAQMYSERLSGLKRQREAREAAGVEEESEACAKPGVPSQGQELVSGTSDGEPTAGASAAVGEVTGALQLYLSAPDPKVKADALAKLMDAAFNKQGLAAAPAGQLNAWRTMLAQRATTDLAGNPDLAAFDASCKTQAAFALHRGFDARRQELLQRTLDALKQNVPKTPVQAQQRTASVASQFASTAPLPDNDDTGTTHASGIGTNNSGSAGIDETRTTAGETAGYEGDHSDIGLTEQDDDTNFDRDSAFQAQAPMWTDFPGINELLRQYYAALSSKYSPEDHEVVNDTFLNLVEQVRGDVETQGPQDVMKRLTNILNAVSLQAPPAATAATASQTPLPSAKLPAERPSAGSSTVSDSPLPPTAATQGVTAQPSHTGDTTEDERVLPGVNEGEVSQATYAAKAREIKLAFVNMARLAQIPQKDISDAIKHIDKAAANIRGNNPTPADDAAALQLYRDAYIDAHDANNERLAKEERGKALQNKFSPTRGAASTTEDDY